MIPHTSCINALPASTYHAMVVPWLTALKRDEIVAVVSYPGSDRERRLNSLIADRNLQNKYLEKNKTYQWLTLDLRLKPNSNRADLETLVFAALKEQLPHNSSPAISFTQRLNALEDVVVLSIIGAEEMLQEEQIPLLLWVSEMVRAQTLKVLLFFETNIFSSEALDVFKVIPNFQPRIYPLTLYSNKDMDKFITHMQEDHGYHFTFNTATRSASIAQCGGNLGLIREILHYLKEYPNASLIDIFTHREMRFTLSSLWNAFGPLEKELLQKIATGQPTTNHIYKAAAEYLLMTGFIRQDEAFYKIEVPLFHTFINESIVFKKRPEIQGGNILINGVYVSSQFSHAEKQIFAHCISHADELITRDTIASLMWGKRVNLKYSDWAIDSTLSRLRKKLTQFGFSEDTIQTKRGQGIIYKSY